MTRVLGEVDTRPIANRSLVVYDEGLQIHRQIVSGKPVPYDLIAAYEAEVGAPASGTKAPSATEEPEAETPSRRGKA